MATTLDFAIQQAQRRQLMKMASASQKKAIKYFVPDGGCIGLFTKVKDETYDELVQELIDGSNSYQKALDKIGLDEDELKEIPPVTLYGYEDSSFTKVTEDGYYRTDKISITHLFFSSTQVYMYQMILNTTSNDKKERTEEYFYKDVTNFSTSSDTTESFRFKGCAFGKPERVSVEIQRFSLIVPGDKFTCSTRGDIESQVKAMKNKLREKKQ